MSEHHQQFLEMNNAAFAALYGTRGLAKAQRGTEIHKRIEEMVMAENPGVKAMRISEAVECKGLNND